MTRASGQSRRFAALLESAGARVIEAPLIAIVPPPSWAPLDAALDALDSYTWVVFTSTNAVGMLGQRLAERGQAWDVLEDKRLAAVGPATAKALRDAGLEPAAGPAEFRAEALLERLRTSIRPGERVLLPGPAGRRDVLAEGLRGLGADVTEVAAYETRRERAEAEGLRQAVRAGRVDMVTFTSSSAAGAFADLFSEAERRSLRGRVAVACIGPVTAETAAAHGLPADVLPGESTIPALARAITVHFGEAG